MASAQSSENSLPPRSQILRITPEMRTPEALNRLREDIAALEEKLGAESGWREPGHSRETKRKRPSEVLDD